MMIKVMMIAALLMGCQTMIENETECNTDGGTMKDQDGKIGPAANVWKIWDRDKGEWWSHFEWLDDGMCGSRETFQWDSYDEASEAFELAYEEDPTSIPELMNFVEFKMVRAQRRSPVGTEIVEYDEKK